MSYLLQLIPANASSPGLIVIDSVTGLDQNWSVWAENIGDVTWNPEMGGERGLLGPRVGSSTPEVRSVAFSLKLSADTKAELAYEQNRLTSAMEDLRRYGGEVVWKPHGLRRRHRFHVLHNGTTVGEWGQVFQMNNVIRPVISFTCAPYIYGDPWDFTDDFYLNRLAGDYAMDAGSAASVAISSGSASVSGPVTTEHRAVYVSGDDVPDHETSVRFRPGVVVAGIKAGVIGLRVSDQTYMEATVEDNGTTSRLLMRKYVGGVPTTLGTTDLAARMVSGELMSVRLRVENRIVFAEQFGRSVTAGLKRPDKQLTHAMTDADWSDFASGAGWRAGWLLKPHDSAAALSLFRVSPFTYRGRPARRLIQPRGLIPGQAPALADIHLSFNKDGVAAALPWGAVAWTSAPVATNMLARGSFEKGTALLKSAGLADISIGAAAASATPLNTFSRFGRSSAGMSMATAAGSGYYSRVRGTFDPGRVYRASLWVRFNPAGNNPASSLRLRMGVSGNVAVGNAVALSQSWQRIDATWAPSGTTSRTVAFIGIEKVGATGTTLAALGDGYAVWDGSVSDEPIATSAWNGRAPWGFVSAIPEEVEPGASTVTTTRSVVGEAYVVSSPSPSFPGGHVGDCSIFLQPDAIPPEDYAGGVREVELWLRIRTSASYTGGMTVITSPPASPFGSTGVRIVQPSSGEVWKIARIGTVSLLPPREAQGSTILGVSVYLGAAAAPVPVQVDGVFLIPARGRALMPTAKPNDGAYGTFWPAETSTLDEQVKIIHADLTTEILKADTAGSGTPMLGSPIEIPPGPWEALVISAAGIPDNEADPSSGDTLVYDHDVHFAVTPRYSYLIED